MQDKVIQENIKEIQGRGDVGIKKYGTTLFDNNTDDFLKHAYEEAADLSNYLMKLRMANDTLIEVIKNKLPQEQESYDRATTDNSKLFFSSRVDLLKELISKIK